MNNFLYYFHVNYFLKKNKKKYFKLILIFVISFLSSKLIKNLNAHPKYNLESFTNLQKNNNKPLLASTKWERLDDSAKLENFSNEKIQWEYLNTKPRSLKSNTENNLKTPENSLEINSLSRSIIFNNSIVGPDISWLVPSGFKWNNKYKFDFLARGHNTRIPDPPNKKFFAWNDGDAVGLFSYQFFHKKKSSFGLNLGIRSLYQGDQALGGNTHIGEGISSGFRWDYALSKTSGIAFGGEQLIHYDRNTDTGRNIYFTASKGWWRSKKKRNKNFSIRHCYWRAWNRKNGSRNNKTFV